MAKVVPCIAGKSAQKVGTILPLSYLPLTLNAYQCRSSVSLITAKEQSTGKYRKELFGKMLQNKFGGISATNGPTVKYDIPKCIYISREIHLFDYILDQINTFL